ncbi:MAG: aspartate/glutamate racemase family protein [Solirubrobacteraceae bacterium]
MEDTAYIVKRVKLADDSRSRQIYGDVIARLGQAGAEGVVLGCTEIELLISAADSPIPVFSTTRLHVEAAVDAALATFETA